jgi:hypothetical protein
MVSRMSPLQILHSLPALQFETITPFLTDTAGAAVRFGSALSLARGGPACLRHDRFESCTQRVASPSQILTAHPLAGLPTQDDAEDVRALTNFHRPRAALVPPKNPQKFPENKDDMTIVVCSLTGGGLRIQLGPYQKSNNVACTRPHPVSVPRFRRANTPFRTRLHATPRRRLLCFPS